MNKFLLCSCIVMLVSCVEARCQFESPYVRGVIDSLEQVQSYLIPKIQPKGKPYVINVRNQEQFDCINDDITNAISSGQTNIRIRIGRGLYHFHENHIIRKNESCEACIVIEGKGAMLTSDVVFSKEPDSPWREVVYADKLIEMVNDDRRLCFIPWKNDINDKERNNYTKVQVLQWYKSIVYDVERIDENGIYFVAPEITFIKQFGREGYSVNYDYIYGGTIPRFRLFDSTIERDCQATCFINLQNSSFKDFTIKGLKINGNKEGESLISLKDVSSKRITVTDCEFTNIRSSVVKCANTSNVVVDNNVIRKTEGDELYFLGGSCGIHVTNNRFEDNGLCLTNKRCVTCAEADYYIANNTFQDFGRTAIGVGVWHGADKKQTSKGIIEHNEIYYTSRGMSSKDKHTLMDSGTIYVWTQNDGVIIRYNYIHDYCGMRFNSGIYCDDGASNCKIYGNIILNTPDGYSIHSRKVQDQKGSYKNNAHNFVASNIVDESVVFDGYGSEERHCIKGANVVLKKVDHVYKQERYDGVERYEHDDTVDEWRLKNGKLTLPRVYRGMVRKVGVQK